PAERPAGVPEAESERATRVGTARGEGLRRLRRRRAKVTPPAAAGPAATLGPSPPAIDPSNCSASGGREPPQYPGRSRWDGPPSGASRPRSPRPLGSRQSTCRGRAFPHHLPHGAPPNADYRWSRALANANRSLTGDTLARSPSAYRLPNLHR